MARSRTDTLILMLMAIVILLMVAIGGLFLRMTQLQGQVLAALGPFQVAKAAEGLTVGIQAPNFTLPDTEDQRISLTDLAGQQVLLALSSTYCPACKEMYPHLRAFSKSNRDWQVIMISRGTNEENRQLVEEQGFDFPVLTWEDAVAGDYQVPGTPFYYAIDGAGVIVSKGIANSLEQLHELVAGAGS